MTERVYLNIYGLIDEQDTKEMITIQLGPGSVKTGNKYRISMDFISMLNDNLAGFYRSSYEENGVTKFLAVTQFESTDARRSFPCFDEPNLKATFSITLGRKSSMNSISNMPIVQSLQHDVFPDYVYDKYQTSIKMSTYLVAMMVSEFVKVISDPTLSPGVQVSVVTRPGLEGQAGYAGTIGPKILKFYIDDYFGIDFPLPKVDMAAIPDFAAGAMENWGLITYREADLLFDYQRSSEVAKQRVAIIVAHELAHQWFGNLVTMDWWNVIWLNEGFATYMEYIGTDVVEPGFKMDDQFAVIDLQYVFGIDALESSRPINIEVNTPSEISQMFDAISYEKGGAILRMCANFLGEEVFRAGITRYLNTNAFGNTVQDDLWASLQVTANQAGVVLPKAIKSIMETWTNQMGYPVVRVTRNYSNNTMTISQERFLLRRSSPIVPADTGNYWYIPLTMMRKFFEPQSGWLIAPSAVFTSFSAPAGQWVIFNVDQVGYYRVLYDDMNLKMIQEQLMAAPAFIKIKNRAQILDDYFNLARAGMTPYSNAFELSRYLVNERDYVPWASASVAFDYIDTMLYGYPIGYPDWKVYASKLIASLYDYVRFTPDPRDPHLTVYARSIALNWACLRLDIQDCISNSKSLYSSWMANPSNNPLDPNLRLVVSCTAVAYGGKAEWDFIYNQYQTSTLGNEKIDYLRAMACSRNTTILDNLLEMIISPSSTIRQQDVNRLFNNIVSYDIGHRQAVKFVSERWDEINDYFNGYQGFGGSSSLVGFFRALCNRVNNRNKLNQLTKLKDDHSDVLNKSRTVWQGLELAQANVKWTDDYMEPIVEWLSAALVDTTTALPPTTMRTSTAATIRMSTVGSTVRTTTTTTRATEPPFTLPSSAVATKGSVLLVTALLVSWIAKNFF